MRFIMGLLYTKIDCRQGGCAMKMTKATLEFMRRWKYIRENGDAEWIAAYDEDDRPVLKRYKAKTLKIG
jgi:hypothetical protein